MLVYLVYTLCNAIDVAATYAGLANGVASNDGYAWTADLIAQYGLSNGLALHLAYNQIAALLKVFVGMQGLVVSEAGMHIEMVIGWLELMGWPV